MTNILLTCFAVAISLVLAEKCVVYRHGDALPEAPLGGRECFQVMRDTNRYCIDYDCPTPECSNPLTPEKACPYCNGTCVHGGKVYKWGTSYTCPDGCNTCSCSQFGGLSTLMACISTKPPVGC